MIHMITKYSCQAYILSLFLFSMVYDAMPGRLTRIQHHGSLPLPDVGHGGGSLALSLGGASCQRIGGHLGTTSWRRAPRSFETTARIES